MKKFTYETVIHYIICLILAFLALLCILPIIHVFFSSISDPKLLTANKGLVLHPLGKATLDGYRLVFNNNTLVRGYINTIIYVISGTTIGMIETIFAAYVLSRKNVPGAGIMTFIISFTMLFGGGLIPTYLVVSNLGMLDTVWAIILPNCVSVFNIMIMRTSFKSIPDGLVEAAEMDGAGHFQVLFKVVLPVSKSILAVVTLFYVIQHWNSWFHTAIYVKNRNLFPLQILLREIVLKNSTQAFADGNDPEELNLMKLLVKYAVIMVSIVPMMMVYPFVQRYFVTGVMVGSIKE